MGPNRGRSVRGTGGIGQLPEMEGNVAKYRETEEVARH